MSTIKVKVTDQLAEFIDTPPIAAGDVNVDAVQFDLSNEWKSGYELMAVFWRADSKTRYTCLLDESYIATVPSEVMKSEGIVVFGVCGISTSKTLTSSTLSYTILDGAVVKFDTANVDIYDELIKLFKNTKITSGQITRNGHLVFKKVDGTTVDVGSGISLTTEQVNTAFKEFIEDYAEEMDYTKVNIAVITRLKEIHKDGIIQFWAGTKAEYEAITPADNVFYIITDEQFGGSELTTTTSNITVMRDSKDANGAVTAETTTETATWQLHKFESGVLEAWTTIVVKKFASLTAVGDSLPTDFHGWYRSSLYGIEVYHPSEFAYVDIACIDKGNNAGGPMLTTGIYYDIYDTGKNENADATRMTLYTKKEESTIQVKFDIKLTGRWK